LQEGRKNVNIHARLAVIRRIPANGLPHGGEGRETLDATLDVGVRLWKGAEFWVNPDLSAADGFQGTSRWPVGQIDQPSSANSD
jgi:hypothetical protein